jgi:hypothetical protein
LFGDDRSIAGGEFRRLMVPRHAKIGECAEERRGRLDDRDDAAKIDPGENNLNARKRERLDI